MHSSNTLHGRRGLTEYERRELVHELVERYNEGQTIRQLAASTGRSYGFVHVALVKAGVQFRPRGPRRRNGGNANADR